MNVLAQSNPLKLYLNNSVFLQRSVHGAACNVQRVLYSYCTLLPSIKSNFDHACVAAKYLSGVDFFEFYLFDVSLAFCLSASVSEVSVCQYEICQVRTRVEGRCLEPRALRWKTDSVALTGVHMVLWQLDSSGTPLLLSKSHGAGQREGNASVSV